MVRKIQIRKGMTLIEVMVTMMVLAMALFYVFLLFTRGFIVLKRADQKLIMTKLAQSRMEDVVANPAGYTGGVTTGNFAAAGYPNCSFTIEPFDRPDTLHYIKITVSDHNIRPMLDVVITNVL